MVVALAFFGITRSLKYTIDSIKENIFKPLEENNIKYDILCTLMRLENIIMIELVNIQMIMIIKNINY